MIKVLLLVGAWAAAWSCSVPAATAQRLAPVPIPSAPAVEASVASPAPVHGEAGSVVMLPLPGTAARRDLYAHEFEEWAFALRGLLSLDLVKWGHGNPRSSGLELDNLNPILTGENAGTGQRYWIEIDAYGKRTYNHLWEAWYEWSLGETHRFKAGQLRVAAASEAGTRTEDLPFVGYGFTSFHVSRFDWGAQVDGYPGAHSWWAGTATVGHGFNFAGARWNDSPQLTLRGVLTPEQDENHEFDGVFGGATFAYNPTWDDKLEVDNPLYQSVFETDSLDGDDALWLMLEAGWRLGPFRGGVENLQVGEIHAVELKAGGDEDIDQITAWTAWGGWNFTGDAPTWKRGNWQPYVFDEDSTWCDRPIELGVRYSNSDIDRTLFDEGFTNYTQSTQEVRTFSAALSGYATTTTRLLLQWTKTIADQEIRSFGKRNRDSTWVLRWDQWF